MIWKGRDISDYGDIVDALDDLASPTEAQAFMALYRLEHPDVAEQNIGYITGYFSNTDARRLQEWCGVSHPFFGTLTPSSDDCFLCGQLWAQGASPEDIRHALETDTLDDLAQKYRGTDHGFGRGGTRAPNGTAR